MEDMDGGRMYKKVKKKSKKGDMLHFFGKVAYPFFHSIFMEK